MKLKDTIKKITRIHLESGGLFFGQCVTAVGWIGGTVPEMSEDQGIVELPTSDSSNSAVVCGAALAGKRPIYAIRYQGFMAYNSASLFNYAAKSIEMWGMPCPVFIRAIGMEGSIGPVASGMFHTAAMHNPGMLVAAPVTSLEWTEVWNFFSEQDSPLYCSEHRKTFEIDFEIADDFSDVALDFENKVSVFGIGPARLEFEDLKSLCIKSSIQLSLINLIWLKPLKIADEAIEDLKKSKFGVIVDSSYSICGAAEHIAYSLMLETGRPVYAIGLADRTAGFASHCDNLTPSADQIYSFIQEKLALEIV